LLVVIGIIAFIAGLVVLLGPALRKGERAARGASQLQGNLFIAKQQGLRERLPYGVRLIRDSNAPFLADGVTPNPAFYRVRSYQFIQQPLDYRRGRVQAAAGSTTVTFNGPSLTGGLPLNQIHLWPVQPGDALQVTALDATLITAVTPAVPPATFDTVTTNAPPNPLAAFDTEDFRVFRQPRPAPGEDVINLPDDIIVDLDPDVNVGLSEMTSGPAPNYYLDILFSPSGRILGNAGAPGRIVLWIRDQTQPIDSSEQSLIVIFTRSGLIASVPVDVGAGTPALRKRLVNDPQSYGGM
jgi:hypothetical protein